MGIRIRFGPRRSRSRLEPLIGGVICATLAAAGFYTAFGDAPVGGGLPLLPVDLNRRLARTAFGAGAVVCATLAAWAFHECLTWRRPGEGSAAAGRDGGNADGR